MSPLVASAVHLRVIAMATGDGTVRELKTHREAGAVTFFDDAFGNGINVTLGYAMTRAGEKSLLEFEESKQI
jgi:hypothetical protein